MTAFAHAVVWIDHHEARILRFSRDATDETVLHPDNAHQHRHARKAHPDGRRPEDDHVFYQQVADALADVGSFLVAGPASAKTELVKHLHRHAPRLIEALSGVESMDKVSDGELLVAARHYFRKADWKLPPQEP